MNNTNENWNSNQLEVDNNNNLENIWQDKNKKLLEGISNEIRSENIKLIVFNILSWIFFLFILIINLIWMLNTYKVINLDITKQFKLFVPWFSIPLFVFALILLVYISLNKYSFNQEKKFHFNNSQVIDTNRVPNFVVDKYKSISGILILYNWFAISSYIISALILTYFFLFRNKMDFNVLGLVINLKDKKPFPNYNWNIIWTSVYLGIVFILHITITIYSVRETSRLTALFDLRKKMDFQEIQKYKRKINIICACLFLAPIVIIFLVFLISRKLSRKN